MPSSLSVPMRCNAQFDTFGPRRPAAGFSPPPSYRVLS